LIRVKAAAPPDRLYSAPPMRVFRPSVRPAARSFARSFARAAAAVSAVLYLSLTLSALTCALHHGLGADCPHHGAAGTMAHPMDPGGGMAGMGDTGQGTPAPAHDRAHVALCHCLDNLAADTPAPLLAAAATPPLPPLAEAPVVPAYALPVGPAAPRGPPVLPA
jgi:hypothetical protein